MPVVCCVDHRPLRRGWAILTLLALSSAGCSSQPPPPPKVEVDLRQVAVLYGRFVGQHRGDSPKDEAEFRKFIEDSELAELKTRGIDSVDSFLTSPRDGKPYVVMYGLKMQAPDAQGGPVIAHEQVGQSGKRNVAFMTGRIAEVDEAEFAKLIPAKP